MTFETETSTTPSEPRRIFLSYARADGRAIAEDLRKRLETGHRVWQDVVDMAGGQDWWVQIEDRIMEADTAVLVVTPAALKSPVVRREWLCARRVGTPCMPVTDDPHVFEDAPRWLRNVDVFVFAPGHPDLTITWDRFIRQVQQPPSIRPVPFMAPGLPGEFVAREGPRAELVQSLLDESLEDPVFSTNVVEGPPGFGKTVLAQEVCRDPNIIDAFTGGILWVTIGEHGQWVLSGLNSLVSTLSGARVAFNTVEEGETRLSELLSMRDCLLVLDDVWDVAHIKPFLAPTHVARIITTRHAENITIKGGTVSALDEMLPDEATQMLLNFVSSEAVDTDGSEVRSSLATLARRLGEWPLLLGIFGGTLRTELSIRGRTFPAAMAWIQEGLEEVGLVAFDRSRSNDRSLALGKSVALSLRPYSIPERQRLFELTVFPPSEPIPEAIALRLWTATASLASFNAARLLRELGGTFFRLTPDGPEDSLNLNFHDALREHLAEQLPASRKREVHSLLVASYLAPKVSPDSVPDDGYLYDHLAYHLRHSGDSPALHALFRDPSWLRARFTQCADTYNGFLADLREASDDAFNLARAQIDVGESPRAVADLSRYRLMHVTIDGLASQLPSELVVRALELGLFTSTQAVSMVAHVPDPADRIRMLQQLLSIGSPLASYRSELETLATETAEEWQEPSVYALTALADGLQGTPRETVLRRALRAAKDNVEVQANRAREKQALGFGPLPFYWSEKEISHAFAALALRLTDSQRMGVTHEGLRVAHSISDPKERAHALSAWMKVTQADDYRFCYQQAIEAARLIENQQERLFALSAIAQNAEAGEQRELLDQIWKEASTIEDEPWRAFCLVRAAPQFDDHRRRQCVELALRSIKADRQLQADALVQGIVRVSRVGPLLELLVPSLLPREAAELRELIEMVPKRESTAKVLLELGLPLTNADIKALFEEILENRKRNYGNKGWPIEFIKLAPRLPASLVAKALEEARQLTDAESRALARVESSTNNETDDGQNDVMTVLSDVTKPADGPTGKSWLLDWSVPTMDAEQLRAELQRIEQFTDENPWREDKDKAYALLSIINQLPDADLHEPWRIAASIRDGWYRSQPLSALALRLSGELRERAASEAVDALLQPGPANADRRANIIEQLIPVLTMPLVTRLLSAIESFEEWGRIRALKALFRVVQAEQFEDALLAVRRLTNDSAKAELLQVLVGSFSEETLLGIVEIAEEFTDESLCFPLLERIASQVNGLACDGVQVAAERLSLSENRAKVLARLLPASSRREAILTIIRQEIVDYLHHGPRASRADVLAFLANGYVFGDPVLDHETVEGVIHAATDICRNWPWQ